MTIRWFGRKGRTDARGRRIATPVNGLILFSLLLFAVSIALFGSLQERQRGLQAVGRENVVWSVLQARLEIKDFVEALVRLQSNSGSAAVENALMRYDILYSRASLLNEGSFAVHASEFREIDAITKDMRKRILDLAPTIDGSAGDAERLRASLAMLLTAAQAIDGQASRLASAAKASSNMAAIADRRQVMALYLKMGGAAGTLVLVVALIVALQGFQMRLIERAGREMADLSDRNARAAEAAEAGTRAKSAFLAAMSHEIRTPLNGIIGMSDILARGNLSAEQKEQVATVRQSGALLLDIVNDVLDFSKVESGRVDIEPEDFSLSEIVRTVRTVVLSRIEEKGLDLAIDVPDVMVRNDPVRLRQVLINLVGNAVKFTPRGSIRLTAEVRDAAVIRFTVEDTGIGIAAEAIPRLFQEFSQIENGLTRRFEGTGLGLAISKRLVQAMGGDIGVTSVPGLGSRFWFEIDGGDIRLRDKALPLPAPHRAESGKQLAGRVLVVEDNVTNQMVICALLRLVGLKSVVAQNGQVALDMLEHEVFDLALVDMQMPVLDGLSTARQIRARGYELPLLGLSANVSVADRQACLDAGMDDFLSKPVTLERILDAIEPWLSSRAAA